MPGSNYNSRRTYDKWYNNPPLSVPIRDICLHSRIHASLVTTGFFLLRGNRTDCQQFLTATIARVLRWRYSFCRPTRFRLAVLLNWAKSNCRWNSIHGIHTFSSFMPTSYAMEFPMLKFFVWFRWDTQFLMSGASDERGARFSTGCLRQYNLIAQGRFIRSGLYNRAGRHLHENEQKYQDNHVAEVFPYPQGLHRQQIPNTALLMRLLSYYTIDQI